MTLGFDALIEILIKKGRGMEKSKKLSLSLLILMLALSSILFVACGKADYSKTYLSASQTYIELFKDEEKNLTITIENPVDDMSNALKYSFSNPTVCDLKIASQHDMTTTYVVTAKNGGNTSIDFVSIDGGKSLSINIFVKEYSSILQAGKNSLYVSSSTIFEPSSSDYIFDDSSTERDLSFYFYGKNNVKGSLTLDDVTSGNNLINNFTKAELYKIDEDSYIIFTDKEGFLYTLGKGRIVAGPNNTTYQFIAVEKSEEGSFIFNTSNATKVNPGDNFTFITQYDNALSDEKIYCERDFTIVVDINKEDVVHEYGYKVEGIDYIQGTMGTSYKIEDLKNGPITLIPNYTSIIKDYYLIGETANYLTAYVEVSVKNLNEFLTVKIGVKDRSVASATLLGSYVEGENTIYCVELNCGTGTKQSTALEINLYYKGFENSTDEKVNYIYSVPVDIHIKPTKLLVNNIDLSVTSKVYKFYNNYASESFGWQALNFTVVPEGAEYDRLYIDLSNNDLQVKYMNVVYTTGILEIPNLNETVYIKGVKDVALTEENKALPINLEFSVIQEDKITSLLSYAIVKGPSPLAYKTEAFEDKIYVERFGGDVQFADIYTDAEFASMTFTHISGVDVANLKYNSRNPFIKEDDKFNLNLTISPISSGSGTYTITLDNGEQIPITIEVGESLNSVHLTTKDENNIIRNMENIVVEDSYSSLIYMYNLNDKNNFDLTVVANDSTRSNAIDEILPDIQSPFISMTQLSGENSFIVYVEHTGTLSLIFTVRGYKINNFVRTVKEIEYKVDIISFNYIERLNVYKVRDGFGSYQSGTSASYSNVYSNTYDEDARKVKLEIGLQNPDAYLFANPDNNQFIDSKYQPEFLYFESDAIIYKDEKKVENAVDIMYFSPTKSNIYLIGDYGTFDTESLTFTAFSNLKNSGNLKLIAHIKQYGKTYSYTINISIEIYEVVERVSLQTATSEIEFSTLKREKSLIAYPTNKTATNGEIVALFVGGEIEVDQKTYTILDENSISYLESDGKTFISLKVSQAFLEKAENYNKENGMVGDLIIVAKDWLDNGGNIRSEYQELALHITIKYSNGSIYHRFTIENVEDLVAMKDNLSAHYQISTTIDASTITNELPLGELKGSIVGVNEYAIITNLNINNSTDDNYYGLFSKIATGAYIEYVQFEGNFNVKYKAGESNVGLIAGENNGKLINVGAKIGLSNVNIQYGNFGGLVGTNNGEIIQDFTLFESNDSNTRTTPYESTIISDLKSAGRYSYQNKTPLISVQMTDFVNVYYEVGNDSAFIARIGGLVGYNSGLIKKVDSKKISVNGYLNYMSYALIKSQPSNDLVNVDRITRVFTGGLVGDAMISDNSNIISGFNIYDDKSSLPNFTPYAEYGNNNELKFEAGEGMIVGGEVWGYGYVGGVIGRLSNLSSSDEFAGITARTFIRGQKVSNDVPANVALIANVPSIASQGGLSTAFAIQAVDDGKLGEESAMAILYGKVNENLQKYLNDINKLGFGNFDNTIGVLNGYDVDKEENGKPINVYTYTISRELIVKPEDRESITITNTSKSSYYGDFVIVGTDGGNKVISAQKCFTKGNDINLSISANFNNKMSANASNVKDVFYAYYFQVASVASGEENDIADVQSLLDIYLNKISLNSSLYPFVANGEMIFSSKTPDVMTIDQTGKITIKKTGLALITASSVLNSNNALNFYIYVVNYFNPESTKENDLRNSIIFNDSSASSVPVDESNIELRGNNSAELFVRSRYDLDLNIENNSQFISDNFGKVIFKGLAFNLAENTSVTAKVIEESNLLEINIIGQSIIIRKNENTTKGSYSLTITPILELKIDEENGNVITYTAEVNKSINKTQVNYQLGAVSITNKNYNTVPIQTSKSVNDEIIINSTDENEEKPLYYIVGLGGKSIQGNIEGLQYQLEEENYLFNVQFTDAIEQVKPIGNGIFEHKFNINLSINTKSNVYTNRYNKEIYGTYLLYVQPQSNSSISICIQIEFEKTVVSTITIDNYKSLGEMEGSSLSTTSDFAYPGEDGLLAITITPEDSDFDYILIENDLQNYQEGNASSAFSLLSRKKTIQGEETLFEEGIILGSTTSKGLKLTQDEIIKAYQEDNIVNYYGVIYIRYSMSSKNVSDLSTSKINVSLYKDGENIYSTHKELKVKLKNFVAIEIEDKEGLTDQTGYYRSYQVARGMKYKLNINSFGFKQENITPISSNPSLGKITLENGSYYLTITEGVVDYINDNEFDIVVEAIQNEGENIRQAESKTKITIFEYVLNYNYNYDSEADIVSGAGEGIINVQVGSQIDLSIDLFEFVEYNPTISSVVKNVETFFRSLSENGEWYAFTNLVTDDQPDYSKAPEYNLDDLGDISLTERKIYQLNKSNIKNYYFKNEGLKLMPIRTHIPEEKFYYFGYIGKFRENNGVYIYDDRDTSLNFVKTSFVLNVYTTSSEESPIPIYDYDDFTKMQKDGYYILLNDITLPNATDEVNGISAFTPLEGNFASFDGNGHAINFAGTYDMGGLSEIGLFKSLDEGSTVKNLIVNYTSSADGSDLNTNPNDTTYGLYGLRTVKFITTADSFLFGTIVAENSGIITNCQVYSEKANNSDYYLTIKADNALTGSSYIGGIVGRNSGFMTNCGASINIKSPFNIGGVVAQNYNKIAGCYFKQGKLVNNSQFSQYVGGFAISNSLDAQILTSYVAGAQSNTNLYSQDSNSYITSTIIGAGFILENLGKVNDCYTDIDLSRTTSEMAGFVYRNSGNVKNCFSLSILRNNTTASAGFVKEDSVSGIKGTFVNCYYYYHQTKAGEVDKEGNINTSLYDITYEGVEKLDREGFGNFEENFSDYSYENGMSVNSVWFVSNGNTSSNYVEYIPTTQKVVIEGENGNKQSNTLYRTEIMYFGLNRLELVSPNIQVLSIRNFSYSDVDENTGNVTYFYNDDSSTPNRGSIHNPRLIYNASSMESEILNQTSSTNLNTTNYRMISDVNYNEFGEHSSLYKVKFAGVLEGNGMSVSAISLVSMDQLSSAGMFAQIGYSQSKQGSVKNLLISPRAVSFNNTDSVGILAGVIKYGYVFDVTTEAVQNNSATVTGLKFVGGVFGKAISSFTIKDVYSSANVSANHSASDDLPYVEGDANEGGDYSYAGSIAGFVGKGKLYNAHVNNVQSVMGGRAGFAYGGIGRGSDVRYTFVNVVSYSTIKPYQYGGYIAGEISGNLSYSYVSDNGNKESTFSNVPKVATAVGGIAGRFNGGVISNALMEQDFRCNSTENNQTITYVGGLVGLILAEDYTISKIEDSIVNADISGGDTLGGGVGCIMTATQINTLAIKSAELIVAGQRANPCLGGIVGSLTNTSGSSLEMTNSYCNATLKINTNTSGVQSTAYAGGLIADAKINPKLYYCYTTSSIVAEVYDSRQIGSLQNFSEISHNAFVSYEQKVMKTDNVYYWGSGIDGEHSSVNPVYDSNFVTFNTKAKSVNIKLMVSNFGKGSTEFASTNAYNKASLNNIFSKDYQITTSNSSVANLEKINSGFVFYDNQGKTIKFQEDDKGFFYNFVEFEEGELIDITTQLITRSQGDLKTYYMVDGNKFEFIKETGVKNDVPYINYYLQLVGSEDMKQWNGISFEGITLNRISGKRIEFESTNLHHKEIYRGIDGNYYLKSLTGYDNNGQTFSYTNIKRGEKVNNVILENAPIWVDDINSLPYLTIESKFNWLNMT